MTIAVASECVMAAVLIHKGSAESRDSDDLMQAALKRIEDKLGTEPTVRQEALRQDADLHVFPASFEGWYLKDAPRRSRRPTSTPRTRRSRRPGTSGSSAR